MLRLEVVWSVVLLSGTALAGWPDTGTPTCPKDWYMYNGTACMKLFTQEEPWEEARRQCAFVDTTADLAVVDTEDKKNFVNTMIHAKPPFLKCGLLGIDTYWIGANDRRVEKTFEWLDTGIRVDYTNWAIFEPNNQLGEDCVEMNFGNSKWNDEDCRKKQCFVCESPVQA